MRIIALVAVLPLALAAPALSGVPTPARATGHVDAVRDGSFRSADSPSVPDSARSGCRIGGNLVACQFRFRPDAGLDRLTAFVTIRDAFDNPFHDCSTSATLSVAGPKSASGCWNSEPGAVLASCNGLVRAGVTNLDGTILFTWDGLGGRGVAEIGVTTHCVGEVEICRPQIEYTSTDMDGSLTTTVSDMAIWAACLPPGAPCQSSDYTCDCVVGIADLAILAGGLAFAKCE